MNAAAAAAQLTVVRAAEITPSEQATRPWLIEHLWGSGAVGVLGGAPKSCKSWLALEIAVAVASGRPCLGRFAVPEAGPVLLYAAEDTPRQIRHRVEQLCQARGAAFLSLELDLILEPSLRVDRPQDLERLRATLAARSHRLLILDPYVRLQGADENNATEVAAILATLREISRTFALALLLVHHTRKASGDSAGHALRGSSDFHAWGDSNLYLRRRGPELTLTTEHRAAPALAPLCLTLAEDPLRLEIHDPELRAAPRTPLEERLLVALQHGPARLESLRAAVGARKQSVALALHALEANGQVLRRPDGWHLGSARTRFPVPDPIEAGTGNRAHPELARQARQLPLLDSSPAEAHAP